MLKRCDDKAFEESAALTSLAAGSDDNGAAVWRRIAAAVEQPSSAMPPGFEGTPQCLPLDRSMATAG